MRLLSIACLLSFALCAGPVSGDPGKPNAAKVDVARLSAMTRDLASEAFEGRAPGTVGEKRTIAYLTDQFRKLGLQPGGDKGGWTQEVPLLRTKIDTTVPLAITHEGDAPIPLVQGRDVYVSTQRDASRAILDAAPMVFVGYGVDSGDGRWDDFKGVDLKGKVAIFLVNDPDFEAVPGSPAFGLFGGKAMTYYGRWTYKFEEAVRRGAVGALIIHDAPGAGYGWETVMSPQGENFDLVRSDTGSERLVLQGWLSGEAASRLFAAAKLDLAAHKRAAQTKAFRPVELGMGLHADIPVVQEKSISHNVIAKIEGRKYPSEALLFAAHWDAYGKGIAVDGTSIIRSGALDDGIGVAGVIELARLFGQGPKPERTLLFAAWTAEERGLLGSEWFAASNLYPADRIIANITIDVLQPNGPARDVILIGQGKSSLDAYITDAALAQGRTVTPDASPERGLFYRADHFSFARRGVPSLLLMALGGGSDLVKGGRSAGDAWVSDYTARCYHQACDIWGADWDLRGAAQDIELAHAIGEVLANSRQRPVGTSLAD